MDFYSSDSFSQSEEYTHTHIHTHRYIYTYILDALKQDLETSGQLSSQELSDTIETRMLTNTHTHCYLLRLALRLMPT